LSPQFKKIKPADCEILTKRSVRTQQSKKHRAQTKGTVQGSIDKTLETPRMNNSMQEDRSKQAKTISFADQN